MNTKYKKVLLIERMPSETETYMTSHGWFTWDHGNFYDDEDREIPYVNYWLEEVIDNEYELLQWKESALKVMNNIDLQKVGKLLGVPLGQDISSQILPSIEMLIKENEQLKKMVSN